MNKNIPNILSFVRIVLTPVVVVLMSFDSLALRVTALVLFCLAMLTDALDGNIARKYHLVSDLGKFLDPLADKILILGVMIGFCAVGLFPAVPVVLILLRELAVTGLRTQAAAKGEVIAAKTAGKIKTASQSALLIVEFVLLTFGSSLCPVYDNWCPLVGTVLIWVLCAITLVSAVPYFTQGLKYLKD